jgi:NAD(P)-dependent dehydrogenase (short-subunit alcohol dehydrogenase family)
MYNMTNRFDAASTADEVLEGTDLRGMRFLVTGISSGVGAETARALVSRGGTVVGTVRDAARATDVIEEIRAAAEAASTSLEGVELDLASLKSVRSACDRLLLDAQPLDVIIANAGIMATDFGLTEDGFETQFGTNHLGHFVLVNRLAHLLREGGRFVSLSSNGHRGADVNLEDPNFERSEYDRWEAYGRSKTANALFAVAFDRRYRDRGIRACAVMPGTSDTPLMRHLSPEDVDAVMEKIATDRAEGGAAPLKLKTVPQMAATSVWAAVVASADEIGGQYLENCHVAVVDDVPGIRDGVMSYAIDPAHAEHLWAKSEELAGEKF